MRTKSLTSCWIPITDGQKVAPNADWVLSELTWVELGYDTFEAVRCFICEKQNKNHKCIRLLMCGKMGHFNVLEVGFWINLAMRRCWFTTVSHPFSACKFCFCLVSYMLKDVLRVVKNFHVNFIWCFGFYAVLKLLAAALVFSDLKVLLEIFVYFPPPNGSSRSYMAGLRGFIQGWFSCHTSALTFNLSKRSLLSSRWLVTYVFYFYFFAFCFGGCHARMKLHMLGFFFFYY